MPVTYMRKRTAAMEPVVAAEEASAKERECAMPCSHSAAGERLIDV